MSHEMVINDATYACCGKLVSGGKCSCKSGHAQRSVGRTSYLARNEGTPEPLRGLDVWNFGSEEPAEESQSVESVANSPHPTISNGGGLPQTDWQAIFNEDAARPVVKPVTKPVNKPPVKNEATHVPLGHATWNW